MYILTAPIFAMVLGIAIGVQIAPTDRKNLKIPPKTGQKQPILGLKGPIVTLRQQWGANFPFTSKLT
ncbi:hypothetical protein [Mesorhizobium australafricanum]|uniref:Uncharacterized protein n=1 Tax=Mesorhizobium australafricanum TaxID=3072311 RepID=A0ABU4X0Q6_9HYPH|nr:hypothetical protein [Mesorhizobium sp. VK3E]MDX8440767.1 hypothetical protein [Mesorhizobium sp. VK3E]